MRLNLPTPNTQANTTPSRTFWAGGMVAVIILTLLVVFCTYKVVRYPYYAATLDFQPIGSIGLSHDVYSSDGVSVRESLGLLVTYLIDSHFIYVPCLIWAALSGGLGIAILLRKKQIVMVGMITACGLLPGCMVFWAGAGSSAMALELESYYVGEWIDLTEKGAAIIDALEVFYADRGAYPEELEQLRPQYLSEIPMAGILLCPEFNYVSSNMTYELNVKLHQTRDGYADERVYFLYYRPEQDYPEIHRRIKQWAIKYGKWVRPA